MSGGDSDSDEFHSADEYSQDDELSVVNKQREKSTPNKPEESPEVDTNPITPSADHGDVLHESLTNSFEVDEIDETYSVKSYRKRPERRKKSTPQPKSDLNPIIDIVRKPDFKPIIDIVKVARPETLVSNITSQLTTNISKGFATFQGTSSSIKGIVSNLAGEIPQEEGGRFVYDDDRTRVEDKKKEVEETENTIAEVPTFLQEKETFKSDALPESTITETPISLEETGTLESDPPLEKVEPQTDIISSPMTSSITDEILKLSEAFEKLKQTRLSEETEPVLRNKQSYEETSAEQALENDNEVRDSEEIQNEGWDEWNYENVLANSERQEDNKTSQNQLNRKEDATIAAENLLQDIEDSIGKLALDTLLPPQPSEITQEEKEEGWDDWGEEDEVNEDFEKLEVDSGLDKTSEVNKIASKDMSEGKSIQSTTEKSKLVTNVEQAEEKVRAEELEEQGWDDWGENDEEPVVTETATPQEDDGWGDWGDDDMEAPTEQEPQKQIEQPPLSLPAKQATGSTEHDWSGWDSFGEKKSDTQWGIGGWGINSILSKATAVTSNLSAVTQGLSNVIETGLGALDPETMARIHAEEEKSMKDSGIQIEEKESSPFPFGNIVSGVGKIVEVAKVQEIGSRVLSGGLDTLETIGKKTMQVLQDGDPGLKKKKALLMGKGKMLSDVLKEARDRAIAEEKQAGLQAALKRCHFETMFDDYQGLVHLEALEMLSKQCELRLEQVQQGLSAVKLRELRDTMEEITQLCEIDEDFDTAEVDNFRESLSEAALPLSNELSVTKILEVHERMAHWLREADTLEATGVYDHAISILAELTAAVTMQFHKSGELLLLKERRKTVEEADTLLQLSSIICSELTTTSDKIVDILKKSGSISAETLTGNLGVETENAVAYIKQAFTLLVPVLQLGAT